MRDAESWSFTNYHSHAANQRWEYTRVEENHAAYFQLACNITLIDSHKNFILIIFINIVIPFYEYCPLSCSLCGLAPTSVSKFKRLFFHQYLCDHKKFSTFKFDESSKDCTNGGRKLGSLNAWQLYCHFHLRVASSVLSDLQMCSTYSRGVTTSLM